MKKFLFAIIATLLLLPSVAHAAKPKDKNGIPFKYDVRVGVSGVPFYTLLSNIDGYPAHAYESRLDDIYSEYHGDKYTTGNISAEFDFIFKDWFTLSLGASFQNTSFNVYDPRFGKLGRHNDAQFSLLPQARLFCVNSEYVRLYISMGLGLSIISEGVYPIFQIAPAGIEVGKKIYGFAEYGIGTHYMGGYIGVGYRF